VKNGYEVVVVGGGIVGTAVAYYLGRHGVSGVLLLEQHELGSGTTGSSAGGVRQQFATPLEVEMSRRGLGFWKTAAAVLDSPCPFHQDGYLLMTGQDSIAAEMEAAARLQIGAGLNDVQLLQPFEIVEVAPWIDPQRLVVASWTPGDGHMTPTDGVAGLAKAARRQGVEIREHWPVTSIQRDAHEWNLNGGAGSVSAKRVVVATGYWTADLLRPLGLNLDIWLNIQYQVLTEPAMVGARVPLTIDVDSGLFVEREGTGLTLAVVGRKPAPRSHEEVINEFGRRARVRAPSLLELKVAKRVTAYPAAGGDGMPYVGEVDEGLWVTCFVGHGAMHGPPVAELVARSIAGVPDRSVDIRAWDPRRRPAPVDSVWWRRPEPEFVRAAIGA
jgi:glycine/D-amino acid oxidase-like deaminating enzyme